MKLVGCVIAVRILLSKMQVEIEIMCNEKEGAKLDWETDCCCVAGMFHVLKRQSS
jgi:hypothetical protein